jgi:hypothetical protein
MEELEENYENITDIVVHRLKFDTSRVLTESISVTCDEIRYNYIERLWPHNGQFRFFIIICDLHQILL